MPSTPVAQIDRSLGTAPRSGTYPWIYLYLNKSRFPASINRNLVITQVPVQQPQSGKNNYTMVKSTALLSLLGLSSLASAKTPTITLPWGVYEGHELATDEDVRLPVCVHFTDVCELTYELCRLFSSRTSASARSPSVLALRHTHRGPTRPSSPSVTAATVSR